MNAGIEWVDIASKISRPALDLKWYQFVRRWKLRRAQALYDRRIKEIIDLLNQTNDFI